MMSEQEKIAKLHDQLADYHAQVAKVLSDPIAIEYHAGLAGVLRDEARRIDGDVTYGSA